MAASQRSGGVSCLPSQFGKQGAHTIALLKYVDKKKPEHLRSMTSRCDADAPEGGSGEGSDSGAFLPLRPTRALSPAGEPTDSERSAKRAACVSSPGWLHFHLRQECSLFLLQGFPATPPRNHNHPQLGGSTPADGWCCEGLALARLYRPSRRSGGRLKGVSSVCRTTVVHGTSFWLRATLFLMPRRVRPSR